MTRGQGLIAAGLAAPVAPALAVSVALVFSYRNGPWALLTFPLWYGFALVAELLLGGPLLLLAWRLRLVTWWTSVIAGGVVGVAVSVLVSSFRPADLAAAALMGALGAAAGLVFWLVARLGKAGDAVKATGQQQPAG